MHDRKSRLAEILRACAYDTDSLSPAEYSEVFRLSRACRIELPRPGVRWPNIAGTDILAGPVTAIDAHGRLQP